MKSHLFWGYEFQTLAMRFLGHHFPAPGFRFEGGGGNPPWKRTLRWTSIRRSRRKTFRICGAMLKYRWLHDFWWFTYQRWFLCISRWNDQRVDVDDDDDDDADIAHMGPTWLGDKLFGQMLVKIPAPWSMWAIVRALLIYCNPFLNNTCCMLFCGWFILGFSTVRHIVIVIVWGTFTWKSS